MAVSALYEIWLWVFPTLLLNLFPISSGELCGPVLVPLSVGVGDGVVLGSVLSQSLCVPKTSSTYAVATKSHQTSFGQVSNKSGLVS